MFFDLHVHADEKIAKEAKRLGYNGISVVSYSNEYEEDFLDKFSNFDNVFTIKNGIEIVANNSSSLKKEIKKFRKKADILIVQGGNLKINRMASMDSRVDIISHPFKDRRDCGLNHILAKKAAENDVAIEINLMSILSNNRSFRSKILSKYRQIIKLHRKFEFPLIFASDAHSTYDLRTPNDIICLLALLGLSRKEIYNVLSKTPRNIIEKNKMREKIIVDGAKLK
jgi:ribonuclease P/MRP protein subunit RPP1